MSEVEKEPDSHETSSKEVPLLAEPTVSKNKDIVQQHKENPLMNERSEFPAVQGGGKQPLEPAPPSTTMTMSKTSFEEQDPGNSLMTSADSLLQLSQQCVELPSLATNMAQSTTVPSSKNQPSVPGSSELNGSKHSVAESLVQMNATNTRAIQLHNQRQVTASTQSSSSQDPVKLKVVPAPKQSIGREADSLQTDADQRSTMVLPESRDPTQFIDAAKEIEQSDYILEATDSQPVDEAVVLGLLSASENHSEQPDCNKDITSEPMLGTKASVAVQANDYEIERRSGLLPARRRIIPFKFRDFHDPDDMVDCQDGDEEYHPGESTTKRGRPSLASKTNRRPGRPKKMRRDHAYEKRGPRNVQSGDGQDGTGNDTTSDEPEGSEKKPRGRPPRDAPSHLPKLYKCLECEKKFSQKGNLKVHMRTHTGERPFSCDLSDCGKKFRSKESLKRHKLAHMGIKLFECDICKEKFSSNVALKEHVARHTDTRPYQCELCDKWFRQISCFRRHLITHSKQLPFTCEVCSRRFSQLVYLKSHMRTHTGEKPYSCKMCGKHFAHHSDLTRHHIVHTGDKPFVCEVCGARFSDPSSRRRHLHEHNGFKPYVCQLCNDAFKRAGQLKAHLNKKHMNHREEVVISKQGPFNSLQFQFKNESKFGPLEQAAQEAQVAVEGITVNVLSNGQTQQHIVPIQQLQQVAQQLQAAAQQQQQQQYAQQQETAQQQQGENEMRSVDGAHVQQQSQQPTASQPVHISSNNQSQLVQDQTFVGSNMAQPNSGAPNQGQPTQSVENTEGSLETKPVILATGDSDSEQHILQETHDIIQQIQHQLGQGQPGQGEVHLAYQIIHDDDDQQIVAIQYDQFDPTEGQVASGVATASQIATYDSNEYSVENVLQPAEAAHMSANVDFVTKPDFNSQEYYNWLSNFTQLCKLVPMPLDEDLCQKITQVHKTLSDVLASPKGILTNKENFRTLMSISGELNSIINEHLTFILQNLDPGEAMGEPVS